MLIFFVWGGRFGKLREGKEGGVLVIYWVLREWFGGEGGEWADECVER